MAQQTINIGTVANDRTGDAWRDAMDKANDNFSEMYSISIPLNSKDDVLANGTLASGAVTLVTGSYYLGNIDMGTDVIIVEGGSVLLGGSATLSRVTSGSSSPTITFINGGFAASGLIGAAGVRINNTGGGAAIRVEGTDTIVFLQNLLTSVSGNALELHNIGGIASRGYTILGSTNGLVMTGTTNTGPILDNFNPINVSGKGVDITGNITTSALRINSAIISSVGNGVDISGDILGLDFSGDSVSSGGNGMRISGNVAGGALLSKTNILSTGSDGMDITGSLILSLIANEAGINSTFAGAAGLKGDAGSANITNAAIIEASSIDGSGAGGTPLSGITKKDLKYNFTQAGLNITDSTHLGAFTLDASTPTVLAFQGFNGTITAFADSATSPGVKTTVSTASTPATNAPTSITGTTSYNGLFTATNVVAGVSFDIGRVFVADDATGNWESGWVKVAGATTASANVERFDLPNDNELRSLDSKTIPVIYTAIVTGQKAGAAVQAYQFALFCDSGAGFEKINGAFTTDFVNRQNQISVRVPADAPNNALFTLHVRNFDAAIDFTTDALTVDVEFS